MDTQVRLINKSLYQRTSEQDLFAWQTSCTWDGKTRRWKETRSTGLGWNCSNGLGPYFWQVQGVHVHVCLCVGVYSQQKWTLLPPFSSSTPRFFLPTNKAGVTGFVSRTNTGPSVFPVVRKSLLPPHQRNTGTDRSGSRVTSGEQLGPGACTSLEEAATISSLLLFSESRSLQTQCVFAY